MSKYFADVSSNNPSYNASAYASGGYAAISIKATEGTGYTNPQYHDWVVNSHRHNLAVFHYHFGRPENGDPGGQARHFWHTVRDHFVRPGDYTVLDLETGDPRGGASWAREFDLALRQLSGTHPIIYTYLSYFNAGGVTANSRKIWIAAYGSRQPSRRLANGQQLWAWQYTDGSGFGPGPQRFSGIAGTSDGSILNAATVRELARVRKPKK